jgi:hypothetical protein
MRSSVAGMQNRVRRLRRSLVHHGLGTKEYILLEISHIVMISRASPSRTVGKSTEDENFQDHTPCQLLSVSKLECLSPRYLQGRYYNSNWNLLTAGGAISNSD